MKRRNPRFGCRRIAQQLSLAFDIAIDKDIVRRVLSSYYRPTPATGGPSWLTFLGYSKDSLWSVDLFRCESFTLNTHWVMVVMDQFTRRIIGFGVQAGVVDGPAICRMFNSAIQGSDAPRHLSSDHNPLFQFHRFKNYVPFWTKHDLERKLLQFRDYYNHQRSHHALSGVTPSVASGNAKTKRANLHNFQWQSACRGLYSLPVAS
jgi:transposase InsO family protein